LAATATTGHAVGNPRPTVKAKEFAVMTSSKLSACKASALILGAAVLLTGPLTTIALAHGHHHHRHGVRILIGGGPGYYGYGGACRWVKLRALETGSPYWWKRYRFCMYG
jgi:hypothetical protein